jgi:hypothetical protein
MDVAHTTHSQNPSDCLLFGCVYSQATLHSKDRCAPVAHSELRHGARCWCGVDMHRVLPAHARSFMYQAHHQKVKST